MKRTVLFAMMMFTAVWTEGEAAVSLSLSQSVEMALSANERIQSAEAAREAAK